MKYEPLSIEKKFAKFSEVFQPKIIARMNDYELKLARSGRRGRRPLHLFRGSLVDKRDEMTYIISS